MGEDLEGGLRLDSQKCQQSAYMWQPWSCISCVAVHRVGLPLGRTASPRFRDAQWSFGRKSRPLGQYPVTADRIVTSRPALIAIHGHRQQAHEWCTQKFGENPAVQTAELQVRGTSFCFGGAVPLPQGRPM